MPCVIDVSFAPCTITIVVIKIWFTLFLWMGERFSYIFTGFEIQLYPLKSITFGLDACTDTWRTDIIVNSNPLKILIT